MRKLKVCYDPLKSNFISKQFVSGKECWFYFSSQLNLSKFNKAIEDNELMYNCKLDKFCARFGIDIEYDCIKMIATYLNIEKRIFRIKNEETGEDYMSTDQIPFKLMWRVEDV